jgi:hypothetical protein
MTRIEGKGALNRIAAKEHRELKGGGRSFCLWKTRQFAGFLLLHKRLQRHQLRLIWDETIVGPL